MRTRWSYRDRLGLALDLLEDSRLDILLTGSSMFADLTDVFPRLMLHPGDELCHLIRYHSEIRRT
jgi:hypothetical protein